MDIPTSIIVEKTAFGLGFSLKDEGKPYESTALVTKVAKGSSAEASGLSVGDRIVAINQKLVKSMTFLEVSNFLRSGSDRNIKLTLLPKLPSPNHPINTVHDLPTSKILTSSKITNTIQSTSLKDSNSSVLRTTDMNNKEDEEAVLSPYCPSVVSFSDETNQNQSKKPPTPKPRESFDKELLNSEEIGNLDNNLHVSNEARKENSYPPTSMQLVHPSLTDNDVAPTKNKSPIHNCDSRDKPGFDTVGIIRKHTMDPTSALYDTGTGTLPVRFIRKRAYASARHPGRYDQAKLLTSVNAVSTTTTTTSTTTVTANHTGSLTNTSPCQLLPAVNVSHKHPISNNIIEPKIIHLPRRRSSGGQTSRPNNSKDKFYLHGVDNNDVFGKQSSQADIDIGKNVSNLHHLNIPYSSPKDDSSIQSHGAYQDQSNSTTSSHATSSNKTGLLSSRLWASFDQDHNESVSELWTRAGEVYHMLEQESQRLANRQIAVATTNQVRNSTVNAASFLVLEQNPVLIHNIHVMHSNDEICQASVIFFSGCSQCAESTRDATATNNPTTKRLQFRSLCSGLRPHRSESNILCDISGSFLSRQCYCKILAIGGSDNKSYAWKPYYMCVSGTEVKFIKASSAFYGAGRTNKFFPIPGLIWRSEQLPTTFPNWFPLGSSSSNISNQPTTSRTFGGVGSSSNNNNNNGIHPDWMDPHYSGLSQSSQQILSDLNNCYQLNTTDPQNNHNTEDENCRSKFRCYRFAHIVAGVELLFVFPDENAAMTCLKMCQLSGGRDYDCIERLERCPHQNDTTMTTYRKKSSSNPYEIVLLKLSTTHHKLSLSEIPVKSNQINRHSFSLEENSRRVPLANNDDVEDDHGGDIVADNIQHAPDSINKNVFVQPSSISAAYSSPYCLLKDRRHRRYVINQSLMNSDVSVDCENMVSVKNPVNKFSKSLDAQKFWSRTQDKGDLGETQPDNTELMIVDTFGNQSQTPDVIPIAIDLPPNMTDLDTPGPIFGAPLESQLESPDYPCVPVLLQAIVIALEIHGLTLPGLYRKPGRHRTIAQFVSSSNSHPEDVRMILSLDAWREPNALCGLFKHFLRRLPIGIFSISSWEPLFCLVPEITNPSDTKQLAYLLLSIRVQLKKIAFDAFDITTLNAMPIDVHYNPSSPNDSSIEYHPFQFTGLNFTSSSGSDLLKSSISSPISPQISHLQSKEVNKSKKEKFMVSKHSFCVWRWATLCYIINHITRVVSYEHRNSVSYQCIAICFGPVFFGNSSRLSKLNEVLEHLFRHWNWLIDGLPLITKDTIQHIDLNTFSYSAIMNEPTLQDAILYLSTKSKYSNKKPILHDSSNNSYTQQPELINNSFCVQDKLTDDIFVQQSSDQEQFKSHPNLNIERFNNEDELNKEVMKNVQSLWLRALDKTNSQPHKHSNQMKKKSSSHTKLVHSKTLYHTTSTVPKKTTEMINGRKGGRRLTVDVLNPSPLPSTYDYYCISPPHLLSTKDKDDIVRLTNIKDISSRSTSRHPPTSQCDAVVRRPVIPVTTHTTTTLS
ncbi:Rho GTPase-activating protein 40 [Schistosoma japonicum]|nr:Rho GTPase-activating protein 40 [Schistosoma japonicum]